MPVLPGDRRRSATGRPRPASPLRVRLANNTFVDLQRGLHFETTPPAASSELVVANNVFVNTPRMATLDKVSVQPARVAGRWIWTEEGEEDRRSSPPASATSARPSTWPRSPTRPRSTSAATRPSPPGSTGSRSPGTPSTHFTQRVYRLRRGRQAPPGPERPGGPGRPTRPTGSTPSSAPPPACSPRSPPARRAGGRPGPDRRDLEVVRAGPRGLDPARVRRPGLDLGPPLARRGSVLALDLRGLGLGRPPPAQAPPGADPGRRPRATSATTRAGRATRPSTPSGWSSPRTALPRDPGDDADLPPAPQGPPPAPRRAGRLADRGVPRRIDGPRAGITPGDSRHPRPSSWRRILRCLRDRPDG